jgi:uncharacterized protein
MQATGHIDVFAPPALVWQGITNPEILVACVPGCKTVTRVSPTSFVFFLSGRWGPLHAEFTVDVTIADIHGAADAPDSYRLHAEGRGLLGLVNGESRVEMSATPLGGTRLSYEARAETDDGLKKYGDFVLRMVARKLADSFFSRFKARLEQPTPPTSIG